jgi:hypothetical protein
LTTYDWIKSFLKITIERRAIYGNQIPFLKITIEVVKVTAAFIALLQGQI